MALGKRGDEALPDAHAWLSGSAAGPETVARAMNPVRNHDGLDILTS